MGLLSRASKELPTTQPSYNSGLLAKAKETLVDPPAPPEPSLAEAELEPLEDLEEVQEPETALPDPSLSAEDLGSLAEEVSGLPKGFDATLGLFSRLSEALDFEGLAVFVLDSGSLRLAASHGEAFTKAEYRLDPETFLPHVPESGPLDAQGLAALGAFLQYEPSHPVYAHYSCPDNAEARLWLAASPALASGDLPWEAFLPIFGEGPRPPLAPKAGTTIKATEAAERLRLGKGSAIVHRFDLPAGFASLKSRAPEAQGWYIEAILGTMCQALAGKDGEAFMLEGGRILFCVYTGRELDFELSRTQFLKSLSRALPCILGPGMMAGASLSLDLTQARAVEDFERFAAE